MRRGYSWCSPGTIHDRKSEKTGVQQCSIKYECYLQLMILAWDSTLDSQARTDSMLVHGAGNDTSEWYRKFQLIKQNSIESNTETYQYFQDNTRVAHRFWGNSDKLEIEKNQIN